jgi:hypothetical protein
MLLCRELTEAEVLAIAARSCDYGRELNALLFYMNLMDIMRVTQSAELRRSE